MTGLSQLPDIYKFVNIITYTEENRNFRQAMTIHQGFEEEFYSSSPYSSYDSNNNQEVTSCGRNTDMQCYVDQTSPHGSCQFSPKAADAAWTSEMPQSYDFEFHHFGIPFETGTRYDPQQYPETTMGCPGTSQAMFDRIFPCDDSPPSYSQDRSDHSNGSVEYEPVLQPNPYCNFKNASQNSLPHFDTFLGQNRTRQKQRGRPPTFHKRGYPYSEPENLTSDDEDHFSLTHSVSKCRRGAKNILLWKFLLEELRKPQTHIKWENEFEGTFKFVDTAECSRRWGLMKKKEDMNFEKLSRGIRHYYKDDLMSRKDGVRLMYKFNWDRVPKEFCPSLPHYGSN